MLNSESRTVEEGYASACASSDLRVEGDRKGDADYVMAAGMSETRMGSALLRLHSEWDRAEKPSKPTKEQINGLFLSMRKEYSIVCAEIQCFELPENRLRLSADKEQRLELLKMLRAQMEPDMDGKRLNELAKARAWDWYVRELEMLMGKLKTISSVREQAIRQAKAWGWERAEARAPEVVGWWLYQACPLCGGTKWQAVKGTGRLSSRPCPPAQKGGCGGAGSTEAPYGNEGKRLANYFDSCVQAARVAIRHRLRTNYRSEA